jgi:hypothetical protein
MVALGKKKKRKKEKTPLKHKETFKKLKCIINKLVKTSNEDKILKRAKGKRILCTEKQRYKS